MPKGCPRRELDEQREVITCLYSDYPDIQKLLEVLREQYDIEISKATLFRRLGEWGLSRQYWRAAIVNPEVDFLIKELF